MLAKVRCSITWWIMAAWKRKRPQGNSGRECPLYSIAPRKSTLGADLNVKVADFGFSHEFTFGSKWDTLCVPAPHPLALSRPKVRWPQGGCVEPESSYKYTGHWSPPFDGQNLKGQEEQVLSGIHHISFYVSTECENLLKKFLTLNSSKGGTF